MPTESYTHEPITHDPVEALRLALVAGDIDRARTLIGGVWHEREGLRRRLAAAEGPFDAAW